MQLGGNNARKIVAAEIQNVQRMQSPKEAGMVPSSPLFEISTLIREAAHDDNDLGRDPSNEFTERSSVVRLHN